ncbi:MAG TPA: AhpC/TSA family protein [Myxococcota bacterium]
MQSRLSEFRERGANVAAIGQGTGAEAARIARMLKLSYACYGDPGHGAYRAFDLGRTGLFGLTLEPFLSDPGGAFRNLRQADMRASASPRSDVFRLGGALVANRAGEIRFLHRSQSTTDVPKTDALLAALDAL